MTKEIEVELKRLEELHTTIRQQHQALGQDMLRVEGAIVTLRALLAKGTDEAHEAQPLPDGAELVEA